MSDAPSRKQDQYIVRLPEGMRDRIKAKAAANHRSMNAELIAAIEAHLAPKLLIDAGPEIRPEDAYERDEDLSEMPPEMRAAMRAIIARMKDDVDQQLNRWLSITE
jgi:hypothetical protein